MARIATFEEFWPFYLSQHRSAVCRWLHFTGTSVGLAIVAAAVALRRPELIPAGPLAGYAFSWVGHFFFEKNRPATLTYPLWSLRADFRMYGAMWIGRLEPELGR